MTRASHRATCRRRCRSCLALAALVTSVSLAAGCGGGTSGAPTGPAVAAPVLTEVRVSLSSDTLLVGQSATASAAGLDQNRATIGIGVPTWRTASASVATVSEGGVVTAIGPGQTTVIASVNGKQGQVPVTVRVPPIARVSITPGSARVAQGRTLQLTATALDVSGRALADRKIEWTSSDASRAAVSSAGVVTAVAPGVVTVSATSEGATASVLITVTLTADAVARVTLTPATGSVTVGSTLQLVAILADSAGNRLTDRPVTWSASGIAGTNVATLSQSGLLTATSPGKVIVQAFSEGQFGAATITVNDNLDASISVFFALPQENELIGDTLRVYTNVTSGYKLASVVAAVGPLRKTLVFGPAGARGAPLWVGLIDITDLPTGPYQVVVTATDIRGARGVGSRSFQRDTRKGKGGSSGPPRMK